MRLWEFGVQDCRLDYLTISLTITSLPLNASLHDAAPSRAWFSATKFTIYQINERRPRPGRFSTKLIFFIFQLMFVSIIFQKTDVSQLPCPRRGKQLRNRQKRAQQSATSTQFLVKLWCIELSWDRGDMVPSQLLGDGREYSNLEFVKNVSDRRAKR